MGEGLGHCHPLDLLVLVLLLPLILLLLLPVLLLVVMTFPHSHVSCGLASISMLKPLYVHISESAQDYLRIYTRICTYPHIPTHA